ncbi:hypothetical protein [Alteromonas sediminis]|uniref:hypothetical protein n=1 Tax=Alteromonas sediminis TaxID=2259342 RepID=UPI0014052434|nr:hypothetical protein [Alteromonas sediminis]
MNKSTKIILLACTFLLAVLCYMKGSVIGSIAFIAIGALLELAFWIGVLKTNTKKAP